MAVPGSTLFSSLVLGTAVRGGLRLASKRGWLPRAYYQRQVLTRLKEKDLEGAVRHFASLRRRAGDHQSVDVVADLLRMHLDAELQAQRTRLAEVQQERAELLRTIEGLRGQRSEVTLFGKVLQFVPSVVAIVLVAPLVMIAFTADPSVMGWIGLVFATVLLFGQAGLNLRRYRRWLKKQRWLAESRALHLRDCQRRLTELQDTGEEVERKIAELEALSRQVAVDDLTAPSGTPGMRNRLPTRHGELPRNAASR